jgi:mono/diheme cytochrome c family protein
MLLAAGWCGAMAQEPAPDSAGRDEFFEKHVRPVLANHCFECHGSKKQEMGVRLDTASGFARGGENGALVDPSRLESSRLLEVIEYGGAIQMPPEGKLADAEIEAIKQWVLAGAVWPKSAAGASEDGSGESAAEKAKKHWAFTPLTRGPIPEVKNESVSRTPIDRFIQAKLEEKGLELSPVADRRTLLRRLSFDLTGLPPTREESTAFVSSVRPDEFERNVDRLLSSPHYAEKWARNWLDVARYADTKGYVFVSERRYPFAYTYRNYVIESLNEDKPYDQFVREQIAADRWANPGDKKALAALGFLTVGRRFLNNGPDIIDDRIDVVTRGLLGLTVSCARCHDHKYDPISTEDYYALYGVFNSSAEPDDRPTIGESESEEEFAKYQRALSQRQLEIDQFIARKRDAKEAKLRKELPRLVMAWHEAQGQPSQELVQKTAVESGLSEAVVRQFLSRWQQFLSARLKVDDPVFALWAMYQATPADQYSSMPEKLRSSGTMDSVLLPAVATTFIEAKPASMREVVERYCRLLVNDAPELARVRQVLEEPGSPVKVSLDETVGTFDQGERNELTNLRNKKESVRVTHAGAPPEAMVLADSAQPQDSPIFIRGNPGRHGAVAVRRYIGFLDQPDRPAFREGSGRKELAEKIASPANPLTARVMVNRIWHWHFGRGLAASTSDFGLRAEAPSHPALLDELAISFVESGWSVKDLHRQILSSSVYRQSSEEPLEGRSEARGVDPENSLLWRFGSRRMTLEEMRDSVLEATGGLDERFLGRSVPIVGEKASNRRAVYAYVDRQNLESFFRTFDFANPNTSAPLRFVTTVPQQALFLLNSPFVIDRCRSVANQMASDSSTSLEHQVDDLYWMILRRPATAEEIARSVEFILAESGTPPTSRTPWIYGWGAMDEASGRVQFQPMEHWRREQWQPRATFPSPEVSHLVINRGGGHPGMNCQQSSIRRFVVPTSGMLKISGRIVRPAKEGDGIRAVMVSSRSGKIKDWSIPTGDVDVAVDPLRVERGETIDFVVEPGENDNFDSYQWSIQLELAASESGTVHVHDSAKDYTGPSEPLSPWARLTQVLLLSNEFVFID